MSIEINQINKSFGRTPVLNDISLDIPSGQMVALLGPSGSGKTTLLRIIAGLEHQNSGQIRFHNKDVSALHARDRQVGFVFQHYALFRHMTVFDNIAFGLTVLPRRERPSSAEIKQRVTRLLEMVQLAHLANRFPAQLSGGQKQRVALARALAARPKVLLFDEPLAALDAKLRERLRIEIGALLKKLAITAVYVTHDQQEAMALGDRIAVMEQGRIAQIDTPQAIYQRPATRFVADFVGAINCVETDARGEPRQFCRPEDILLADDSRYARHGYIVGNTFLGAVQRLQIDIGLAAPIQVERHAREAWHAGQRVTWTLAPRAALDFTGY